MIAIKAGSLPIALARGDEEPRVGRGEEATGLIVGFEAILSTARPASRGHGSSQRTSGRGCPCR